MCPEYCYGNLTHLFAYNNILWEYHSPRETWHPQTQNKTFFQPRNTKYNVLWSTRILSVTQNPLGPAESSRSSKILAAQQNPRGPAKSSRSSKILTVQQNPQTSSLKKIWKPFQPVLCCAEPEPEPIIMSGKLKSASGTQTIAGIKYEERRVKDSSDQYCKYCRHKSYLANIFMKTCGPTVPTLPGLSASTFTFKDVCWVEILYKSN